MNYDQIVFLLKIIISLFIAWFLVQLLGEWNNYLLLGMIFFLMWTKGNKKYDK